MGISEFQMLEKETKLKLLKVRSRVFLYVQHAWVAVSSGSCWGISWDLPASGMCK